MQGNGGGTHTAWPRGRAETVIRNDSEHNASHRASIPMPIAINNVASKHTHAVKTVHTRMPHGVQFAYYALHSIPSGAHQMA